MSVAVEPDDIHLTVVGEEFGKLPFDILVIHPVVADPVIGVVRRFVGDVTSAARDAGN